MKVDWKPFNREDPTTWPPHAQIVWVSDKEEIALVKIDRSFSEHVYFDPIGAHGHDTECTVYECSATHWAPAELPELPA